MQKSSSSQPAPTSDRRSFIKKGIAAGAVGVGVGYSLLGNSGSALAQDSQDPGSLSKGDAALLRFAAAAEILESDFWLQYNELGGIQDKEVSGGTGIPLYTQALSVLDSDFPQYLHDNTDDEITHFTFLNAYLESRGADAVNLDKFRMLEGSTATGVNTDLIGKRLTNLTQLTLDTSWWTRYRSSNHNPDLDPNFKFPQAVPDLHKGKFTAIPRTDKDLHPKNHIQAIANTAGFHMPTIEQGGNSLYPSMAQRASSVEVLRILISIGPTETMHFQTWSDKAGNAPPLTDPTNGLTFPNLNSPPFGGERFQTNLIMPEPCPFISRKLPKCSIIRPTETKGIAMGVVMFLTNMGLFIGQPKEFFETLQDLAAEADAAEREC
jgi:Ferritin-like domain